MSRGFEAVKASDKEALQINEILSFVTSPAPFADCIIDERSRYYTFDVHGYFSARSRANTALYWQVALGAAERNNCGACVNKGGNWYDEDGHSGEINRGLWSIVDEATDCQDYRAHREHIRHNELQHFEAFSTCLSIKMLADSRPPSYWI